MKRRRWPVVLIVIAAAWLVGQPLREQSQPKPGQNHVFFELGGSGLLYSVNYERLLSGGWNVRLGWSTVSFIYSYKAYFGGATKLLSSPRRGFELGGAVGLLVLTHFLFWEIDPPVGAPYGGPILGYRYLPESRGPTFRIAATPLVTSEGVTPWVGLSVGYAF